MSCSVGCRGSSDPVLLWLWYRLAAIALIQSLAWKPPYAMSVALKRQKKKKLKYQQKEITKIIKQKFGDRNYN